MKKQTKAQARALVTEILTAKERLCDLVADAYTHQTHLILGYNSWEEFVDKELHMSRRRSYQLLDQSRANRDFSVALGFEVILGEREVRGLRYDGIQEAIRETESLKPLSVSDAQKVAERAVARVAERHRSRPATANKQSRSSSPVSSSVKGSRRDVATLNDLSTQLLSIDPARIVSAATSEGASRIAIMLALRTIKERCQLILDQLNARGQQRRPSQSANVAESVSA